LLLLHGGPGFPSHYLDRLAVLGDERPVVFYDQLGCGRSERPSDKSLWTIGRFADELQQVRDALGLEEVHLLGHSWGTMLAAEYLLGNPRGVRSVTLSGPILSSRRYLEGLTLLRSRLPEEVRAVLDKHETAGTVHDAEYQKAVDAFYARHLSLLPERPPELRQAFEQLGVETFETMWGPSEFVLTGNLRAWDVTDRIGNLRLPVLLTAGRQDLTRPEDAAYYRHLIPGARLHIFEGSAHFTMLEDPQTFVSVVRRFLREEDARARTN
jgi:proline iminopeptidase